MHARAVDEVDDQGWIDKRNTLNRVFFCILIRLFEKKSYQAGLRVEHTGFDHWNADGSSLIVPLEESCVS